MFIANYNYYEKCTWIAWICFEHAKSNLMYDQFFYRMHAWYLENFQLTVFWYCICQQVLHAFCNNLKKILTLQEFSTAGLEREMGQSTELTNVFLHFFIHS